MRPSPPVNRYRDPVVATRNAAEFSVLLQRLTDMPMTRDRMGAFYGEPGLGKTKAAAFVAGEYRTRYVTCGLLTTARSMLTDILSDLGEPDARGTNIDLLKAAVQKLAYDPQRPLIVDEAHYVADKRFVDVLRHLHDLARVPIVLIGEKSLMRRLEKFPMVRSRIGRLAVEALPTDLSDLRLMAEDHFPGLQISDELAQDVLASANFTARDVVSRLGELNERALLLGKERLDLDDVREAA